MVKKDNFIARRAATLILKITLFVLVVVVAAIAVFALPNIYHGGSEEFPTASRAILLIVIALYVTIVPFLIALWQVFKVLSYIDKNQTFSDLSVRVMRNIKYCWTIIGILYMGGIVPSLYPIADADDAPGLLLFGFAFACIPFVIAIFAEVLERLLQNALDIKSENELTV